jgi:hypothetical protein
MYKSSLPPGRWRLNKKGLEFYLPYSYYEVKIDEQGVFSLTEIRNPAGALILTGQYGVKAGLFGGTPKYWERVPIEDPDVETDF